MTARQWASSKQLLPFLASYVITSIILCVVLGLAQMTNDRWRRLAGTIEELRSTIGGISEELAQHLEESDDSPTPLFGFREGVVFAVGHLEQGDLQNNDGICPDDRQQNWLQAFKKAVAACAFGKKPPLKLTVRGYASVAPVTTNDGTTNASNVNNLEIANRRGIVIANFLASESNEFDSGQCNGSFGDFECKSTKTADGGCLTNSNYVVKYSSWPDYETMKSFTPVHDGDRPDPLKFNIEFLNRAAHVVVENSACWRPGVMY